MGRTENINVFQDTMNLCKNNDRIRESVHNSAEGQKLILEEDAIVESDKNRYKENPLHASGAFKHLNNPEHLHKHSS